MKRIFDIFLVIFFAIVFIFPFLFISILVLITSPGPILFWSERVGRNNRLFKMPKFRSMGIDAPLVETNLLEHPEKWLTPIGSFIRKTSLDELPQLWSILIGDMSFVGPRPVISNQIDIIVLRTSCNVHKLLPGLTGWAQINGRDNLPTHLKVKLDEEYMLRSSFFFDCRILLTTVIKVLTKEGVCH